MKKLIALAAVSLFSLTVLTQCCKEEKEYDANFYTSTEGAQMWLYLDDAYKGELPYMSTIPDCGTDYGDGTAPLHFVLKTGTYKVTGKNAQGVVVSEAMVTIRKDGIGGSGRMGGNRVDSRGDNCIAVGLFE